MCGICGKITTAARPVEASFLLEMADTLRHRGPDDEGIYLSSSQEAGGWSIGLGHRRLSIIDLSEKGRQPLSNEDGTIWVVCNGEIYNFQELRKDLEAKGHRFQTDTDTEVIVHLYEELGEGAIPRLRGMFSFALWDDRQGRLLLARDRAGKKPLFYCPLGEGLVFASSLNALLVDPEISRKPNFQALQHYLCYLCVPSPQTAFRNVFKLPPANYLVWEKGRHRIERYWTLSYGPKTRLTEEEAAEEVLALLREAVEVRLVSDVPLGAFLSGGLDSSAVVALMAESTSRPVETFSIGFDDGSYDERKYARLVAERFGTTHHEFTVEPAAAEVLPELIRHFGEPFADPSALPTFYLARLTREHVTVALSGDGSDEGFGGYERYVALALCERLARAPGARSLARAIGKLTHGREDSRTWSARLGRFCTALGRFDEPSSRYAWLLSAFSGEAREVFSESLSFDAVANPVTELMREEIDALGPVEAALRADFHFYLPEDILVKVDVASMFHSLEVRCPFLDHKVLEFAAKLPISFKVNGLLSKALLKRHVFRGILPPEILGRQKKGFGVPLGRWFREELGVMVEEHVLNGKGPEIIRPQFARALLEKHHSGRRDHGSLLWVLLCLALWHETFF